MMNLSKHLSLVMVFVAFAATRSASAQGKNYFGPHPDAQELRDTQRGLVAASERRSIVQRKAYLSVLRAFNLSESELNQHFGSTSYRKNILAVQVELLAQEFSYSSETLINAFAKKIKSLLRQPIKQPRTYGEIIDLINEVRMQTLTRVAADIIDSQKPLPDPATIVSLRKLFWINPEKIWPSIESLAYLKGPMHETRPTAANIEHYRDLRYAFGEDRKLLALDPNQALLQLAETNPDQVKKYLNAPKALPVAVERARDKASTLAAGEVPMDCHALTAKAGR